MRCKNKLKYPEPQRVHRSAIKVSEENTFALCAENELEQAIFAHDNIHTNYDSGARGRRAVCNYSCSANDVTPAIV